MWTPKIFQQSDWQEIQLLIQQNPLATVIRHHADGIEVAHIPMILQCEENGQTTLLGHFARHNPIVQGDLTQQKWLVIFQNGGHYITPNWYPNKSLTHKEVPTWNYQAVHIRGQLRVLDNAAAVLSAQTDYFENRLPENQAWHLSDAPEDYLQKMYGAIVCVALSVDDVQAQFKLSQNKSADTRQNIGTHLRRIGSPDAENMADLIDKFGR